ncbi:hypothetical protein, partial [Escherichia coli]|uniref:hypothetical protein n=1 Tax=Escherichia coli TaxID=562 RepID=UPI0020C5A322
PPEWREKQKGSRGIRRGQRYRLVFQFPIREHFLSGINIRNNAVFCLLGLLLKNIAVRMTGNRSRKNTKKQDWHTFFHGIIPDSLTIKSHWE